MNQKKIKLTIIAILFLFTFFFLQAPVLAQGSIGDQLIRLGSKAGFSDQGTTDEDTLVIAIGRGISFVLSFLGVIFIILVIYAGFMWMTAGGNEQQVDKARKIMTRAIIGVIIILASYAITWFVMQGIENV